MRILFISIEFTSGTFSGNGVYAQSQVRALTRLGHHVLVLAGCPRRDKAAVPIDSPAAAHPHTLVEVGLSVWRRLDQHCSWLEFAKGAGAPSVVQQVRQYRPEVVLAVDWHSLGAFEALASSSALEEPPVLPYVYMNYRVFLRTSLEEQADFFREKEGAALRAAALTVVLSRSDAQYLADQGLVPADKPRLEVLLPALRSDMAALPLPADVLLLSRTAESAPATTARPRRWLACCVRASPEKHPERFVGLLEELSRRGAWERHGIQPLFCAADSTPYALDIKARLKQAAPCCVLEERFLGPAQLAEVYAATRLNVHPCLSDAFGMTIVEAASQGAPSLVHGGGAVGASDLLSACSGELFETDLSAPMATVADKVESILADERVRQLTGRAAAAKARSWTETENARALLRILADRLLSAKLLVTSDRVDEDVRS